MKRSGTDRDTPLVTVVVCAYNPGGYLREAVESLLNQTHPNLEILVFDDGSTDDSFRCLDDLRDPRLQIHRHQNEGKPRCLNRALGILRGEFLAIQDADDSSHPRRIEKQVAWLLQHPDLAGVFCGHELIIDGRHVAPRARHVGPEECARLIRELRMPAHDPTVMYRVSAIRGEEFVPELTIGEGVDFAFRIGERLPLSVIGECLYSYRIHAGSLTATDWQRREGMIQDVYRRACRRRGWDPGEEPRPSRADRPRNRDLDNNLAAHFMESAVDSRRRGEVAEALRTGLTCARMHPLDPYYYRALAYALLPQAFVGSLRRGGRPSVAWGQERLMGR